MLERAGQVVGNDAALNMSGTFHSVCARLLRRYAGFIGYPASFQILDEDDHLYATKKGRRRGERGKSG